MKKPRICVTIVKNDLQAIKAIEPDVSLFEVRIDLVGPGWTEMVKDLKKPWIACNRIRDEGGKADSGEVRRIEELLWAAEAGACIVDLEYRTENLADIVPLIKSRAECMLSYHDMVETPSNITLAQIVEGQIKSGADICKVVTTANDFEDNLKMLKLISHFPEKKIVAFAMGEMGAISRILSPLAGGYFTYASMAAGQESAPGQVPAAELNELYDYIRKMRDVR
ncbi:MAG: type I 3-dehydroquinate dehydratase [Dehalococcoidales bacterium]|nr:type I 3-dehydroquinate dehydratase [Dehalococcoidales bacterium]